MAERRWFGRVWECERQVSKKHRRDIACEALGTARVWVPRGLGGGMVSDLLEGSPRGRINSHQPEVDHKGKKYPTVFLNDCKFPGNDPEKQIPRLACRLRRTWRVEPQGAGATPLGFFAAQRPASLEARFSLVPRASFGEAFVQCSVSESPDTLT